MNGIVHLADGRRIEQASCIGREGWGVALKYMKGGNMVPYTTGRTYSTRGATSSNCRKCPYCGQYIEEYTTFTSSFIYKTETPSIEVEEKPRFNFMKKVGRLIEKKVLYNVWKPIRG